MTLNGKRVLVTRPAKQADKLCGLIAQHGGVAVRLPTLAIVALPVDAAMIDILQRLDQFQWLIFVSANAVDFTLQANNGKIPALSTVKIAAVGQATARALHNAGMRVDLLPTDGFNSEALLASPAMQQVTGQHVLIVRGRGGREILADNLRQRGATVHYLEVYQRDLPIVDTTAVRQLLANQQLDVVTVTSAAALHNLLAMLGEDAATPIRHVPLVVISQRIEQIAQKLGFRQITVAAQPSDAAILEILTTQDTGKASGRSD